MIVINGDLRGLSGLSHIGVDGGGNQGEQFDITSLTPFGHIHQISGVFHDPLLGQSGVLRFSQADGAFQVSVDGGNTFNDLSTGGGGVTSIGVLGDANLTGAVDLASPASGFIVIEDSSDASPLLFSVDQLGLSGLWSFPSNGFPAEMARCFSTAYAAISTTITVTHNIGTEDVLVQVYDNSGNLIIPDNIERTDTNTVTVTLNSPGAGRITVIGCV